MPRTRTTTKSVGDLESLIPSFCRSLRAASKAATTIEVNEGAARQLLLYLEANGLPTELALIGHEHVVNRPGFRDCSVYWLAAARAGVA